MIAVSVAVGISNTYWITLGLVAGAVQSFKRTHGLIYLDQEPGWFALNLCMRVFAVLLGAAGAIAVWRNLRSDLRE